MALVIDSERPSGSSPRRELKFTTRIGLLFGALGLLALLATMAYSLRVAQNGLYADIANNLEQRHRTVARLIGDRMGLLDVYLQSASANRVFSDLVVAEQPADFQAFASELAFLFQDSAMAADLDVMFLLDTENELLIDTGLPLYNIDGLLADMRSPIQYTGDWQLVRTDALTALLRAVPIFDPATVRLRGYLFVGLALGQNRSLMERLVTDADVDGLAIDDGESLIKRYQDLAFTPDDEVSLTASEPIRHNGFYIQRDSVVVPGLAQPLWLTVALDEGRFASIYDDYWRIFLLLSGGFLALLMAAAWLINWSNNRAINNLTRFISAIQQGRRHERYQPGGVYEYNQVGFAMERMVEDLNIAATVFESANGMIVTDANMDILRVNQAFTEITGYRPQDIVGRHLSYIDMYDEKDRLFEQISHTLSEEGVWQGDVWSRRSTGEAYPQWTSVTAVLGGVDRTIQNYVVTMIDTSETREAETRIEQLAFYDQLTELPNRELLRERLDKALKNSDQSLMFGALIHIDLDDFKTVNDTGGYEVGDRLLARLAVKLTRSVRPMDTVARVGGDEFCLILEDLGQSDKLALQRAEFYTNQVFKAINTPLVVDDRDYYLATSIGITLFQGTSDSVTSLMKQAELAMYQAKRESRNGRRFYNPRMQEQVLEYVSMAADMRNGLSNGEFVPYFQPQVDALDRITGYELLLRWHHDQRGVVSPMEFIPVAEDNGMIVALGNQVLSRACREVAEWASDPQRRELTLAVNISARQLRQPDFTDQVTRIIEASGCDPSRLKLEITESMLMDDIQDSVEKIVRLKALGVRFALDDFGTGYSSLSYLKRLPLDELKIDKSFVRDLLTDPYDADIARTIVSLALSLGIDVIAEGVETREQRDRLAEFGCYAYQGYFYGKPVPFEELAA